MNERPAPNVMNDDAEVIRLIMYILTKLRGNAIISRSRPATKTTNGILMLLFNELWQIMSIPNTPVVMEINEDITMLNDAIR
ncbi:hypothetical protein WICMUC_004512 [Wickerhamomyces mucosus]|uniref:Uncharacterized protein n=1 Tax=Wickerhamomyces mucosus TaxID=1378264 RepID=A0A9P8TB43_9ASCO|nr:hypothetical protein WICMUC_004512 [Wickerhamomyces mucosus]